MLYKLRVSTNGRQFAFNVPPEIGQRIAANPDLRFECRVTPEGLLYAPMKAVPDELPDWLANKEEGGR